jgi:hypothetical protein
MGRTKFYKFRLTRKQKRTITVFLAFLLCAGGVFWILVRPGAVKPRHPVQGKILTSRTIASKATPYRPAVSKAISPPPAAMRPLPVLPAAGKFKRLLPFPKIAFVIDDIGGHDKLKTQLAALGSKVTYAILPLLPYSRYFGHLGERTHADVILHLPLDTMQDMIPGPGLIVNTMSDEDILELLGRDLDSVPNHIGANNHMGSRGTTDRRIMKLILSEFKRRNLFFLDSYTTLDSVVREVGHEVGVPVITRGVFLDNVDARPQILGQLQRVKAIARKKGNAIAIGHYRKLTLEILAEEIPRLEHEGFEITTLREILRTQKN